MIIKITVIALFGLQDLEGSAASHREQTRRQVNMNNEAILHVVWYRSKKKIRRTRRGRKKNVQMTYGLHNVLYCTVLPLRIKLASGFS